MAEEGSQIFAEEDYDLDLLLSAFADTAPQPISDSDSPVSVTSDPIPDFDPAASLDDLERFLMSDEAEEGEGEGKEMEERQFFDGLFVDDLVVGNETETESDQAKSSDDGGASTEKGEVDKERDSDDGGASTEKGEIDKERESDDDPATKKIKRQMRNRDSAKSSRERKKEYIKELEMKSRYLESECKRLNYALQCFMTENMALRQSMQCKEAASGKGKGKGGPHSGDVAMRESAVLLSESRQLGSLHCLVSIMWSLLLSLLFLPFPLPTSPRREPVPTLVPRQLVPAPKDPKREIDSDHLYLLRRRCKESRYQMQRNAYLSCLPVHRDVSV
ncbi:hypothetical protein LUZ60_017029 [Juncus effusus]|nr:hypothetical protein LUZ60_017029 [Juncus effusus]